MTTRHLFISFFLIYGLLIPVFAQEFVTENTSASIAMVGSCIIIALLFWIKRVFFINVIVAFYVFQSYLIKPFISIFEKELSERGFKRRNDSFRTPGVSIIRVLSPFCLSQHILGEIKNRVTTTQLTLRCASHAEKSYRKIIGEPKILGSQINVILSVFVPVKFTQCQIRFQGALQARIQGV